jgi:hypothetical protein
LYLLEFPGVALGSIPKIDRNYNALEQINVTSKKLRKRRKAVDPNRKGKAMEASRAADGQRYHERR